MEWSSVGAVGRFIKSIDPYDHLLTVHSGTTYYATGTWQDFLVKQHLNMDQSGLLPSVANSDVLGDLSRNKPVLFDEFGIEGFQQAVPIRKSAWAISMAGGYPAYLGSGPSNIHWTTIDPAVSQYFEVLNDFMEKTDYRHMTSDNSLVSGGGDTSFCLAKPDAEYVVYLSQGGAVTVDLSGASGSFSVEWYNPEDGTVISESLVTGGSSADFTAPDLNDWILHIGGQYIDSTPPAVMFTSPAADAIDVLPDTIITAAFSEAIDKTTVTATSFTINNNVTGQIGYYPANSTVYFIPSQPLAYNTAYTARLTTEIRDLYGNPIASDYVWTFTIGASTDTVPPVISDIRIHNITPTTATVSWITDELADSRVDYGLDANYGNSIQDSLLIIDHSIVLTGLAPNTPYHYMITSADATPNVQTTSDAVFSTVAEVVSVIRQDCAGQPNCYTSLSAWEAAENRDLVAANEVSIARIEGEWTAPDTTPLIIDGWVTGPDNYIRIYTAPDARHKGTADTGYALVKTTSWGAVITNKEDYARIEGLIINAQNPNTTGISSSAVPLSGRDKSDFRISHNIIYGAGISTGTGVSLPDFALNKVWNNIIYNFKNGITGSSWNGNADHYIYNNTIVGCDTNFGLNQSQGNTNLFIKNNIAQSGVTADYNVRYFVSGSNISQDVTSPDGVDYQNITVAFADIAGRDFHLISSDTSAKDTGADLSSDPNLAVTDDIDGEIRIGVWDIGADEITTINSITISSLKTSNITETGFDVSVNFTGDDNADAQVTLFYCNVTDMPGCAPLSGASLAMTRGTGIFTASVAGLGAPDDPGDSLSLSVTASDPDGVQGSPLTGSMTLAISPDTTPPAPITGLCLKNSPGSPDECPN